MVLHAALLASQNDKRARLALPVDRDLSARPPEAVGGVIDLLSAPGEVNLDAVVIAMQSLDIDAEALGDAVFADNANYVRTLLYRDPRVEMLALTWLPGQRSPVHDHGGSTCVVRIVSGLATEHLYRRREDGAAKREYVKRVLRPGVVVQMLGDQFHSLGNGAGRDGETLVTLHVYSPPLAPR